MALWQSLHICKSETRAAMNSPGPSSSVLRQTNYLSIAPSPLPTVPNSFAIQHQSDLLQVPIFLGHP